jgi:hypothetical protein
MNIPKGAMAVVDITDSGILRYALGCVQLAMRDGMAVATATDGRTIVVASWADSKEDDDLPALLPASLVRAAGELAVSAAVTSESVALVTKDPDVPLTFLADRPDGRFPDTTSLTKERPRKEEIRVWVDARRLAKVLGVLVRIADSERHSVCLRVSRKSGEDPLHLVTRERDGVRGFAMMMPLGNTEDTAEEPPDGHG